MECHVLSWSACGEGAGCGPFGRGARIVPPAGWPSSAWRFPPAAVPFRRCEAPPRRDPGFRAYPARGRAGVCVGAVRAPDRPREAGDARLPSAESGSFGLRAGAGGRRSARTPPLSDPSYHGFSWPGPEKEKHYRNFMNICRSLSRPLTLPSRKRERSIHTSGLNFGLIGRWRLHIVAPDPDPGRPPLSRGQAVGTAPQSVPVNDRWYHGRAPSLLRLLFFPSLACEGGPGWEAASPRDGRFPAGMDGFRRLSGTMARGAPTAGRRPLLHTCNRSRKSASGGLRGRRGTGRMALPSNPGRLYRKEFGMRKALPNAGRTMGIMGNCCV